MHNINNTISSNTMKYCIVTKTIVSIDTFLYLWSTIIYSSQDFERGNWSTLNGGRAMMSYATISSSEFVHYTCQYSFYAKKFAY